MLLRLNQFLFIVDGEMSVLVNTWADVASDSCHHAETLKSMSAL